MATTTETFPVDISQFDWAMGVYQIDYAADVDVSLLDDFFDEVVETSALQEEVPLSSIPTSTSQHSLLSVARPDLEAFEHAAKESPPGVVDASPANFEADSCQKALSPRSRQTSLRAVDTPADLNASFTNATASSIDKQRNHTDATGSPSPEDRPSRSSSTSSTSSLPSPTSVVSSKASPEAVIDSTNEDANEPALCEISALTAQGESSGSSSDGLTDSPSEQPKKATKSSKRKRSEALPVSEYTPRRKSSRPKTVKTYWNMEHFWICELRDRLEDMLAEKDLQLIQMEDRRERLLKEIAADISRLENEKDQLGTSLEKLIGWGKVDQHMTTKLC